MSPLNRLPRPLIRDAKTLRDDRLFIVACDDTFAPKQYFDFFRIVRVQIHVIPSQPGRASAQHVLESLQNIDHEEDDELWLVLDTDHYISGAHLASFNATLATARRQGINVALSRPCFEVWLLLHHAEVAEVVALGSAAEVEQALRNKLGQYNKTNLRREHFPLDCVPEACRRARALDQTVGGGVIPSNTTTRVHLLWDAIVAKALPSQLPEQLVPLIPR